MRALVFGLFKSICMTYQFVNRTSRRVLAKSRVDGARSPIKRSQDFRLLYVLAKIVPSFDVERVRTQN